MRTPLAGVVVWAVAVLTACADGDPPAGSAGSSGATDPDAGAVACVEQAVPVGLPADFPTIVPLPESTVVTSVDQRSEGRTVIDAVVPEEFSAMLVLFQDSFPAAGLDLEGGEVEEHDAESEFRGGGYEGRWKLTDLPDCGDTRIELVVAPG